MVREIQNKALNLAKVFEGLDKKPFVLSFWVHCVILLMAWIAGFSWMSTPVPLVPSLQVDLVDLPSQMQPKLSSSMKKLLQESKNQVDKKKSGLAVKTREQDSLKAASKSTNAGPGKSISAKKAEPLSGLEALRKQVGRENLQTFVRGNKLSSGTSLESEAKESDDEKNLYFGVIKDRLVQHWHLPSWLLQSKFKAQVILYLKMDGYLDHFEFQTRSGHPQFDRAVEQALKSAEPFQAPPQNLRNLLKNTGILIGFPLAQEL